MKNAHCIGPLHRVSSLVSYMFWYWLLYFNFGATLLHNFSHAFDLAESNRSIYKPCGTYLNQTVCFLFSQRPIQAVEMYKVWTFEYWNRCAFVVIMQKSPFHVNFKWFASFVLLQCNNDLFLYFQTYSAGVNIWNCVENVWLSEICIEWYEVKTVEMEWYRIALRERRR